MDGQDWSPVVIKRTTKPAGAGGGGGAAGGGGPSISASAGVSRLRKLEDDNETTKHETVSLDLRLALQQAVRSWRARARAAASCRRL
jgi:hypothetical protein